MFPIIPDIQKYAEKAKNFVITESFDVNDKDLFNELTKRYLSDLYENQQYPKEIFVIARNDLMFYYKQMDEAIKRIKIVQ